jgi:hypothetical protein
MSNLEETTQWFLSYMDSVHFEFGDKDSDKHLSYLKNVLFPLACSPTSFGKGFKSKEVSTQSGWMPELKLGLTDDVRDALQKFTSSIDGITSIFKKPDGTLSVESTLKVTTVAIFDSFIDRVPSLLVLFFSAYKSYETGDTKWLVVFSATSVTVLSGLDVSLRNFVHEKFNDMLKFFSKDVKSQSGSISFLEPFSKAFMAIFSWHLLSGNIGDSLFRKINAFVTSWPKFDDAAGNLTTSILTLVQTCINFVRDKLLGWGPINMLATGIPELERWCGKVDILLDESRNSTLIVNSFNAERVYALMKEGNHLSSLKLYNANDSAKLRSCLQVYLYSLRKVSSIFDGANLGSYKAKMEPLTILLRGASGVGKSCATIPLLIDILKGVLSKEQLNDLERNHNDYIYPRQAEHKFWDGYRGQFCTIWDDFRQIRDVAGNPDNELMDVIRACNLFPHMCHMASIENKGNTVFQSRVCVFTSNMKGFHGIESIIEPEAVARRFNFIVDVVPKIKYCTKSTMDGSIESRRLDTDIVKAHGKVFNDDVYEFHIQKFTGKIGSDTYTSSVVNWPEFVLELVAKYKEKANFSDEYNAHLKLRSKCDVEPQANVPLDLDEDIEEILFDRKYIGGYVMNDFVCELTPDEMRKELVDNAVEPNLDLTFADPWKQECVRLLVQDYEFYSSLLSVVDSEVHFTLNSESLILKMRDFISRYPTVFIDYASVTKENFSLCIAYTRRSKPEFFKNYQYRAIYTSVELKKRREDQLRKLGSFRNVVSDMLTHFLNDLGS